MNIRKIILATGALCLSGCAMSGRLHEIAVDYNTAVARSANEVTLLNIARAANRQPMHFTGISSLNGGVTLNASGKFSPTLSSSAINSTTDAMMATSRTVNGAKESYTPSIDAGVSTSPSIDVSVYDGQDFYRGIISSVSRETIHHYLRQGWRDDLLTYLLIEEVTLSIDEGDERRTLINIQNDPDNWQEAQKFNAFVACTTLEPIDVTKGRKELLEIRNGGAASNPGGAISIDAFDAATLNSIAKLDGKIFDLLRGDENRRYIGRPGDDKHELIFRTERESPACTETFWTTLRTSDFGIFNVIENSGEPLSIDELIATEFGCSFEGAAARKCRLDAEIRSVQGIMYYLGELARAPNCPFKILTANGEEAIFALHTDEQSGNSSCAPNASRDNVIIKTSLDGRDYWVTDESDDRSLQVISLVQQLLNLNKSADERPTTERVRLVQ